MAVLALAAGLFSGGVAVVQSQDEPDEPFESSRVLALEEGWNLVSWTGFDTPVEEAVGAIVDGFERVLRFEAPGQRFSRFDADAPGPLNSLSEMALGDGLWVQVAQDTTWIQARPMASRDVEILPGFNLVSWTGPSGTPIAEALGEIVESVDAVFTFDPPSGTFESFRPALPAPLNDPIFLDYGRGLWVLASESFTWRQPGIQRVGVQDMWVFTRLVQRSESGEEIDLLAGLEDALAADLGPDQLLPFGMTFRSAPGLAGVVQGPSGEPLDSVSLRYGLIKNGQELDTLGRLIVSDLTDVFFPDGNELLVAFSTARFDLAERNIGEEDFILLDLARFAELEPGDTLVADIAFGQLVPPLDPALEDGLTPTEIFYRRWMVGAVIFTGADEPVDGEFIIFEGVEIEVVEGALLTAAELQVSQSRGLVKLWGKLRTGAREARKVRDKIDELTPGWLESTVFVPKMLVVDGLWITSFSTQLLVNAGTPPPATPPVTAPPLTNPPPDKQPPTIKFETVSDGCDADHGWLVVRVSVVDSGGLSAHAFSADAVGAAETPKSERISGSEEVSSVRFSNSSDSPKTVTIVTRAVDQSGNETREQREFTVQPLCAPASTSVGFLNTNGFSEEFDAFAMVATEVIVASSNSLEPLQPMSFDLYQGSQSLFRGSISDCLNPMVCSGPMVPGAASSWSAVPPDRLVVRDRHGRAVATWNAAPPPPAPGFSDLDGRSVSFTGTFGNFDDGNCAGFSPYSDPTYRATIADGRIEIVQGSTGQVVEGPYDHETGDFSAGDPDLISTPEAYLNGTTTRPFSGGGSDSSPTTGTSL